MVAPPKDHGAFGGFLLPLHELFIPQKPSLRGFPSA